MPRRSKALLLRALLLLLLLALAGCAARRNPYDVLGVARGASAEDIKRAHKRLAIKFHPDKNPKGQERFLEVQAAYELLADDARRREYDLYGFRGQSLQHQPPPHGYRAHPGAASWGSHSHAHSHRQHQFTWGGFGFARAQPIESDTLSVTARTLDTRVLRSDAPWLIEVYADACDACARSSPAWEAAAAALSPAGVKLGRIDAASEPALSLRFARGSDELPVVFGVAPGCHSVRCARRLRGAGSGGAAGGLTVEALLAFAVDDVARLPRVKLLSSAAHVRAFLASQPDRPRALLLLPPRPGEPPGGARAGGAPAARGAAARLGSSLLLAQLSATSAAAVHAAAVAAGVPILAAPAAVVWPAGGAAAVVSHAPPSSAAGLASWLQEHAMGDAPPLSAAAAAAVGCVPPSRGGAPRVCVLASAGNGASAAALALVLRARLPERGSPPAASESPLAAACRSGRVAVLWLDEGTPEGRPVRTAALAAARPTPALLGSPLLLAVRLDAPAPARPTVSAFTAATLSSAADVDDDLVFAALQRWLLAMLPPGAAPVTVVGGTPPAPLAASLVALMQPTLARKLLARARGVVLGLVASAREYALASLDSALVDPRAAATAAPLLLVAAVLLLPPLCARGGVRPRRDSDAAPAPARAPARAPAQRGSHVTTLDATTAAALPARGAYTVTILLPPANADADDAHVAAQLAARFHGERRLVFVVVDTAVQHAWAPLAREEGPMLAWHTTRLRYTRLGSSLDAAVTALERLLDGATPRDAWEDASWPQLV